MNIFCQKIVQKLKASDVSSCAVQIWPGTNWQISSSSSIWVKHITNSDHQGVNGSSGAMKIPDPRNVWSLRDMLKLNPTEETGRLLTTGSIPLIVHP